MEEVSNKRPSVDWEAVERDFCAGILSLREIAELHPGTNHVAISRKAKKEGWLRSLTGKIQAKADELVTRQSVTTDVTAFARVSERQIIETNAQAIVNVRLSHRADLGRGRNVVAALLAELETQCGSDNAALLEHLGEMMRDPDEFGNDRLNDIYQKIISLPGRAKTMKDLAESLSKLIDKERQAFGLDKDSKEEDKTISLTDVQRVSRLATLLEKARRVASSSEEPCSTD